MAIRGCHVLYKDISYVVKDTRPSEQQDDAKASPRGEAAYKYILRNVSFSAEPGQLIAIMGPSGSGKTSLLNIIGGRTSKSIRPPPEEGFKVDTATSGCSARMKRFRKEPAEPLGHIFIDGQAADNAEISQHTRYVMQKDILQGCLTVKETLSFGAKLRLTHLSSSAREERCEYILKELGLDSCRDVYIGDQIRKGVSGGQKKRVAIGLELLSEPRLLYLDEPTSGLDASLAYDVIKTLRSLANAGMTIIATIHQPRPQIFQMFDRLLLLSRGETVYFGNVSDVNLYLHYLGCPPRRGFTIPDHLLDLLSPKESNPQELGIGGAQPPYFSRDSSRTSRDSYSREFVGRLSKVIAVLDDGQIEQLPAKFKASKQGRIMELELEKKIERISQLTTQMSPSQRCQRNRRSAAGSVKRMFMNMATLASREFLNNTRFPVWLVGLAVTVVLTLVVGLVYQGLKKPNAPDDCKDYFNLLGAVAFSLLNTSYVAVQTSSNFPNKRPQYNREVASKLYHPFSYFVGMYMAEMPKILLYPTVHCLLIYWLVEFGTTAVHFFYYILLLWMIALAAVAWSFVCAMLSPSTIVSSVLSPMGVTLMVLLSGVYIMQNDLPIFWKGVSYVAWMKYGINGYMLLHYDSLGVTDYCGPIPHTPGSWGNIGLIGVIIAVLNIIAYLALIFTNQRIGLEV